MTKINAFAQDNDFTLYQGSMLDMAEAIADNSIDAVVTDPPYELNFMGKGWDNAGVSFQKDTWVRCYNALKPGGYLLAFGGSRTFHRIACAIEDAGFDIRDTIMWIYGSGFPKSMNIGLAVDKKNGVNNKTGNIRNNGKATNSGSNCYNCNNGTDNSMKKIFEERIAQNEWQGWGSQLKPSFEPIIVARKPFSGSLVDNVMKYGVGGLNIDECRVGNEERTQFSGRSINKSTVYGGYNQDNAHYETVSGRFPANTILTYGDDDKDEVCSGFPNTKSTGGSGIASRNKKFSRVKIGATDENYIASSLGGYGDIGSAARYFYTAKASRKDRDEGLDEFEENKTTDGCIRTNEETAREFGANSALRKNIHPTVKPTDLMQYLVRLVTPRCGVILDPFNGSGSTGKAVMYENNERDAGYKYIGIELSEDYLAISKARIEYAKSNIRTAQMITSTEILSDVDKSK